MNSIFPQGKGWRAACIRYAPLILWTGIIFYLSSDMGSSEHTSRIIGPVLRFLFPDAAPETIAEFHGYIRKLAHLSEYALLALIAARAAFSSPLSVVRNWWFLWALIYASLIAAADEFGQSFNPNRTGTPYDSLLDIVGACFGIVAFTVLRSWLTSRQPQQKSVAMDT